MAKMIAPEAEWPHLVTEVKQVVPEAFDSAGRVLNLVEGDWGHPGQAKPCISPVDGTILGTLPMLDLETGIRAVKFAAAEFPAWSQTDLDQRRERVTNCLVALREHRELLARLLMWEIGKPYRLAMNDVERCISGVAWYVEAIEPLLAGRTPIGVVSDIASWNYPLSVLVHAVLVQALAGNAVIAKTPTDGGLYALTVSLGLARRCGLPVSLVTGFGSQLGEALVRNPNIDCLGFVGGRSAGREVAASLYDANKRYMLEMEGINTYGIWEFSDWASLASQLKKGFDYGKQRCTAYARYVIQRRLFPQFLEMYLGVLKSLRLGNPLLVEQPGDPLPALDFGPLINSRQVDGLKGLYDEALNGGAISLYEGAFDEALFLPGQDRSAYMAPATLLNVPRGSELYHKEPFGPVDTVVIVDRVEELINEMNISNGCLVSAVGCDDPKLARTIADEVRSFKVGINQMRSRGDNEEVFGGLGQSWKGCFVGGKYLVQAVTQGPPGEPLYGNFTDYQLLPEER